jgi:hypothetical protein
MVEYRLTPHGPRQRCGSYLQVCRDEGRWSAVLTITACFRGGRMLARERPASSRTIKMRHGGYDLAPGPDSDLTLATRVN